MTRASDAGIPAADATTGTAAWRAAVTAAAVGLLVGGTLGTLGAVLVGAALLLLGLPDDWASAAAALTAAAGLVPTAGLVRRVWRVERHGPEA